MSRILLIGPPGAGKSTVGEALAKDLQVDFIDTDQLIEEETGKTITDIFVVDGEPHFRLIELETLRGVLTRQAGVISLGGGAPSSERDKEFRIARRFSRCFSSHGCSSSWLQQRSSIALGKSTRTMAGP